VHCGAATKEAASADDEEDEAEDGIDQAVQGGDAVQADSDDEEERTVSMISVHACFDASLSSPLAGYNGHVSQLFPKRLQPS
jgi:hypothetical protein